QDTTAYFHHVGGGVTVNPVAAYTVYANTSGSGARTTQYFYTWYSGTPQVQSKTTDTPVVSAAQNGSGDADETVVTYDARGHAVRTYAGWDATAGLPTGPTAVTREDWSGGYTESLTMSATPHLTGGVPDGTEAVGGVQSLSRRLVNNAGQVVSQDDYF